MPPTTSAPNSPGVGIQIFSPTGTGVQQQPANVIFTTKYPFAKLDTQLGINTSVNPPTGPVSFQNISIFFNDDPPATVTETVTTQVYQFAHGYNYIPTWWMLYQNPSGNNNAFSAAYGQEASIITGTEPLTYAAVIVTVDDTYFYISIQKAWATGDPQPEIVGYTIKLRIYIFTDPIVQSS